MSKITIKDIREYQKAVEELKEEGTFTAGNFKRLGRQLKDKFNLTDLEAINILNSKDDEILKILESQEDGD